MHSEDPSNTDPPATTTSISYTSPHHFSTFNSFLKVLTIFYLVAKKNYFLALRNPVPDALILYEHHHL